MNFKNYEQNLLIGNGFDLAHGLKTNYRDFIRWFWTKTATQI
ncbi:MAG: bacteriophage abortive infection AbiH family protein [Bacteroidales bacterium]|nr:bacteriophage abortive infection AbiH family protein [Bacteroidales bacterium]